jgi:hypothetical protein
MVGGCLALALLLQLDSISNGRHFEKHDLEQWRCIQMAGILKSMTLCNRAAFKRLAF